MSKDVKLDVFLEHQTKKEQRITEEKKETPPSKPKKSAKDKINDLLSKYSKISYINTGRNLLLLGVEYNSDKNRAMMKFYDIKEKQIKLLLDSTNHKPYFITDINKEILTPRINKDSRVIDIKEIEKYNALKFKTEKMVKITVSDPLAVGGKRGLRESIGISHSWEAWIPYHLNYIYDRRLWPGMIYDVINGIPNLTPVEKIEEGILQAVDPNLRDLARKYINIFSVEIPLVDFIALDIEVAGGGKFPQMDHPKAPIIAVSFTKVTVNDERPTEEYYVFLLRFRDLNEDNLGKIQNITNSENGYAYGKLNVNGKIINLRIYSDERHLLLDTFNEIYNIPLLITFNGDNFDLRYIYKRALELGIAKELIPFRIISKGAIKEAQMLFGVHIDLYKFFSNAAIKSYAFANIYESTSLETISTALLGIGKRYTHLKFVEKLSYSELAAYCWWDSFLTAKLFMYDDWLPWRLLIILSRITRLPVRELSRRGVSAWIESWFYAEHRDRGYLIPNRDELDKKESKIRNLGLHLPPVIKGKSYRGAIVFEPKKGIWFNVWVLDFASIYPTIIKVHNISYETVCCPHDECKSNKVSNLPVWICTKKRGIASELVGFIRDVRVNYFKKMLKEGPPKKRPFYNVIQGALKVLINASYGVFGAEHFPFFSLTVAELITAIGREKVLSIAKKAKEMELNVIYGDTDSIFIYNPEKEKIRELIEWSEHVLKVDLDVDKIYRYVAFSERKKNYFGILNDGSVDIKGLLVKKRNTPEFLKNEFKEVLKILGDVHNENELENAKKKIEEIIINTIKKLRRKEIPLEDLAFRVQITKPISEYVKTTPQHVKAAKKLKRKVLPGEIISFVKTKDGVAPLEIANIENIDWSKYEEYTQSVFDQLLDALGMSINEIISKAKGVVDISKFFE